MLPDNVLSKYEKSWYISSLESVILYFCRTLRKVNKEHDPDPILSIAWNNNRLVMC